MGLVAKAFLAMIPTTDLERARAWYSEKLGIEPVEIAPEGSAFYEAGNGTRFLLYQSQFAGTNEATTVTVLVDDVEGTVATLRDRGVEFEEYDMGDVKTVDGVATFNGYKSAWFKDGDGNIIGLGDM